MKFRFQINDFVWYKYVPNIVWDVLITKIIFIVYLKLKFHWATYLLIYYIQQPLAPL